MISLSFMNLCGLSHLSHVALICVQNRHIPSVHRFLTQYAILVTKYFLFVEDESENCLGRQLHLSPDAMSCVQNPHTPYTPQIITISDRCVAIYFFGVERMRLRSCTFLNACRQSHLTLDS